MVMSRITVAVGHVYKYAPYMYFFIIIIIITTILVHILDLKLLYWSPTGYCLPYSCSRHQRTVQRSMRRLCIFVYSNGSTSSATRGPLAGRVVKAAVLQRQAPCPAAGWWWWSIWGASIERAPSSTMTNPDKSWHCCQRYIDFVCTSH